MKKIKLLLLILLTLAAINGCSQAKSKEEMINRLFTVLKNKDENGFVKLFPDAATMKQVLTKLIPGDIAAKQDYFDDISDSSLQKQFRHDFGKIIERGENKGVNWKDITLISYTADSSMMEDDEMKVASLKGKIYYNSPGKEYFLEFKEVIWFPEYGWYGVEIRRIDEKSEENTEDPEFYEPAPLTETQMAVDSTVPPIKMPVPKSKPPVKKAPVKKAPVKPKAAKKPD
jgi:hypothetical protein